MTAIDDLRECIRNTEASVKEHNASVIDELRRHLRRVYWIHTARLVVAILMALALVAMAAAVVLAEDPSTWIPENSGVLAWDAVTTNADGTPIDTAQFSIKYEVAYRAYPAGPIMSVGTTGELEKPVTISEGKYLFGVRASKCFISDPADCQVSDYAWSDNPVVVQAGQTFGMKFIAIPTLPGGLRPVN